MQMNLETVSKNKTVAASRIRGSHALVRYTEEGYSYRRCDYCALVEQINGNKKVYSRGGEIIATLGKNDKQPPCK